MEQKVAEEQQQTTGVQRYLEQNRAKIERLGLPPAHCESDTELPQWLHLALPLLRLHARVVDYLPSQRATLCSEYLQRLGFVTTLENGPARQRGNTCGIVSAKVSVDCKRAHDLSPGSWRTCPLEHAVSDIWYQSVNPAIGMDVNDTLRFISASQVIGAVTELSPDDPDVMTWFPAPDTYDVSILVIVTDLHCVARDPTSSIPFCVRVSNTHDCRSRGMHWFTIAYGIEVIDAGDPTWNAVRAAAIGAGRVTSEQQALEEDVERAYRGAPIAIY